MPTEQEMQEWMNQEVNRMRMEAQITTEREVLVPTAPTPPDTLISTIDFTGRVDEFSRAICDILQKGYAVDFCKVNGRTFFHFYNWGSSVCDFCDFEQTTNGAKLAVIRKIHIYLDNSIEDDKLRFHCGRIVTNKEIAEKAEKIARMNDERLDRVAPILKTEKAESIANISLQEFQEIARRNSQRIANAKGKPGPTSPGMSDLQAAIG